MRRRSRAEQATSYPTVRKLTGLAVVLLAISLPALCAFTAIDAPMRPSESHRVAAALLGEGSDLSEVGRLFYGAALRESDVEVWRTQPARIVVRARLSGMLVLFVISGLVYLILAQVRGRATGVAGSLSLATLAPVAGVGFVLRPEQLATMFGLLGVALLVGLPMHLRSGRYRPLWGHALPAGLTLIAGLMFTMVQVARRRRSDVGRRAAVGLCLSHASQVDRLRVHLDHGTDQRHRT